MRSGGGTGADPGVHRIEWRIVPARNAVEAELASTAFNRPLAVVPTTSSGLGLPPDGRLLSIAGGGVVSAIKPATRGSGVILRVMLLGGAATVHLSSWLSHTSISVVDLAERDLELAITADDVTFDPADGSIRTVRLQ